MDTIICANHGETRAAFVCEHIVTGLNRRQRVGFFCWPESPEDPFPDACCYECNELMENIGEEWEGNEIENLQPKVICTDCYAIAKIFHMGGNPWS